MDAASMRYLFDKVNKSIEEAEMRHKNSTYLPLKLYWSGVITGLTGCHRMLKLFQEKKEGDNNDYRRDKIS